MEIPKRRLPVTAILSVTLFLIGMAAAAIAPYRAIAAIEGLGMSNSVFALVITLGSLGTALTSLVLGYFADRISDRRLLVLVSSSLGALAYGLIYLFPTQLTYILSFCLILPFGGALFSQTFSFSRAYYDLRQPQRAQFMMSVLRTLFSLAWVLVPPVAGWIASAYSVFDIFATAALAYVGCTLIFGLLLVDSEARVSSARKKQPGTATSWQISPNRLVGIGGVTLVRVALALHLMALPLALVKDFGGTLKDVGINASLAAGLEVPFMLAWGLAAARFSKEAILVVNSLIYALYLLLLFFAHSVRDVLWLQGLNAIATAALLSITISYMQEVIKGRVGLSTALMDVVTVVSTLIASATFAVFSSRQSYITIFAAASLLSLAGASIIALSRVPGLVSAEEATRAG
ncbi:MAG: MFS transporter [Thermaceae bacterium]|nr:MFS transporter [Thermaceae bacterium]